MSSDWEPWKHYPNIWKNKTAFYTWLRGCLRNAVWNKSPIKIIFKNDGCSPPPDGYEGRAKSGAYCALSGEWEGKSKLEVDHIEGNVSLLEEEDIIKFIKHLIPPPNSLQLVTKEAHKVKSYSEKQGISYEQAAAEKEAILIIKEKGDIEWLVSKGLSPSKNQKDRRKQIVGYLLNASRS